MPTSAKRVLAKRYSGYTVKEAIQFDRLDDGIAYYISAEKDKESVILQVEGSVSVFKKGNENISVAVLTD